MSETSEHTKWQALTEGLWYAGYAPEGVTRLPERSWTLYSRYGWCTSEEQGIPWEPTHLMEHCHGLLARHHLFVSFAAGAGIPEPGQWVIVGEDDHGQTTVLRVIRSDQLPNLCQAVCELVYARSGMLTLP